ncbi:MAG TPA: type II toxin-antitoxin system PemK/MazF family toxin [Pseudonocardiaceae bacterium]|jgi:mRNA interferase MazF|nr:type II toxin-antitoxin system PemK/MazF family toxin [Pseudonocardiaceae bacterium]
MNPVPMRGHVYRVDLGGVGLKPYVIVSNNVRNRKLNSALGVRITTTDKNAIPTAVRLTNADPLAGFALADDIIEIYEEEIASADYLGSLSPGTIMALDRALAQALGLP